MSQPDRNLALELVRVTETAAYAGSAWVGRGDKDLADHAAVEAMRGMINTVDMDGIVVIGDGEKITPPCFTMAKASVMEWGQSATLQLIRLMEPHSLQME